MTWLLGALSVVGAMVFGYVALKTPSPMYRDNCDEHDRCVYDPRCPFYGDCELTDYTE